MWGTPTIANNFETRAKISLAHRQDVYVIATSPAYIGLLN
jgi:hypothetical protein